MSELLTKIGIIDLDEGHDNSPKGQMGYYDKSVLYSYDDICNRLTCDIDVNSTASDTASFRTKACLVFLRNWYREWGLYLLIQEWLFLL